MGEGRGRLLLTEKGSTAALNDAAVGPQHAYRDLRVQ